MNDQEEIYFQALSRDRSDSANTLEKPSMRGIKNSVVEKYSDQAHFIYELLQNANDAGAKNAKFILEPDKLIFAHNGTRYFSVSNPDCEDYDSQNGTLGDINSITSIANSNKTEASIGKFGVGFKAVFQYTATPHIYDPNFRFRIERFIVPTLLHEDFPSRLPNETLFVFPFDHSERNATEAYNDIANKLKNLSFPLLFLSCINEITFEFDDVSGFYEKEIQKTRHFGNTTAEYICFTKSINDTSRCDNLWLFSRADEHVHSYSVGYFMLEDHLVPVKVPAYCFFPTKEVTGLNFIIHAPFLLTDSREGIRAGIPYNDKMLQKLSALAADSLVYLRNIGEEHNEKLIDDRIFDIIPVDPNQFSDPADKEKVSFLPFYEAIRKKFASDRLLPATDGYVETKNAYWAAVPQLTQLFSNEQLGDIVENLCAKWVFVSYGRDETQKRNNKALFNYLDALARTNINEDIIIGGRSKDFYYNRGFRQRLENIRGLSAEFIEAQSFDWLHSFYKWLSETKHRIEIAKDKPIFIDQNGNAAAAFDKSGHSILFLPVDVTGYRVINQRLLDNPETRSFVEQIGIKQPSLRDQIYNIILPMYQNNDDEIDTEPHFELFFKYFCKCSTSEADEFINLIKDYEFLDYYNEGEFYRGAAAFIYLPTEELKAYFETKKNVRFLALDEYKKLIGTSQESQLMRFLSRLGVQDEINLIEEEIDYDSSDRTDLPMPHSTREITWHETNLDGCEEIVQHISTNKDAEKSYLLWSCLLKVIETKCSSRNCRSLESLLRGVCHYFYYSPQTESFYSSDALRLKKSAWLVDSNGKFVSAEVLTKATLSARYYTMSETAQDLLDFLGIVDESVEDDNTNLTASQKEKIELADKFLAAGLNEDDLLEFQEFKRQKEARKLAEEQQASENSSSDYTSETAETTDGAADNYFGTETRQADKTTSRVMRDIINRTKDASAKPSSPFSEKIFDDSDIDQDEYTPATINYGKRIENAKQKSAAEIEKIIRLEELQTRAENSAEYSYGWFKTLLEMESINSGEANANSKEISISFAKVEREPDTMRTLILKHPNQYIPQFMEDLADIPLVLHMENQSKTVAIEVASIKSYTLRVKLKNSADIDGIDLSSVTAATIDAKSPAFLIEELRKQFIEMGEERGFDDDYDMQKNLCENIEFVFGPPGTGKTTHLAKKVLIPMMKNNAACKVLVLTPTNKSADVLVKRIMELSADKGYNEWLVRFGGTGEEEIEQSPIFRDKTFDIRTLSRNVTVTTIARFPYDFFMPAGTRIFLRGINWDYIVIDEASMIPVANIVFPLYKKTPKKFIIAGDPFQIEPITSVDHWKNKNIYTMVHLDSFTAAKTVPYQYKVELLTTQYRSIPDIGYVFSHFAYKGILKHNRTADSRRSLNFGTDFDLKTFNIIKFPVKKYESIYRCKRLRQSSSYQVYSALFTFEFICCFAKTIAANNRGSLFKIGVIAPYRAQADMIDKLLASEILPKETDVQVGTIHGFQGDECDIIFVVFNTPPTISASKEMFLNKLNIINVSISRARDYLFIIMPDDDTENISNLRLVKRVEQLTHETNAWKEFSSPDLEEQMFGDPNYLENNSFSTGHQSVNVYGLPEKRYEVRMEDAAVDVQIHKVISTKPLKILWVAGKTE